MWGTHFVVYFVPKSKHIQVPEATSLRDACGGFSLWESHLLLEAPKDFKGKATGI